MGVVCTGRSSSAFASCPPRTPLHCAASCNNVQVCKFLVESGAAVFATTYSDTQTAADKCEEVEEGYAQCSQFLYGSRQLARVWGYCLPLPGVSRVQLPSSFSIRGNVCVSCAVLAIEHRRPRRQGRMRLLCLLRWGRPEPTPRWGGLTPRGPLPRLRERRPRVWARWPRRLRAVRRGGSVPGAPGTGGVGGWGAHRASVPDPLAPPWFQECRRRWAS